MSAQRTLRIGGVPEKISATDPTALITQNGKIFEIEFKAEFLHGPIADFNIEVREGYGNFTGPSKLLGTSANLSIGNYCFVATSNGYKSDMVEMGIDSAKTIYFNMIFDKFEENEAKVLLSWNGKVNLMMRSSFVLNSEIDCEVSYTNKVCGGVRKVSAQEYPDHGYEEFTIKSIGAYQYLFYALQSNAENYSGYMKVYIKSEINPIAKFGLGSLYMWNSEANNAIWAGFCMDGKSGVSSIIGIQSYLSIINQNYLRNICTEFYGEPEIFDPSDLFTVQTMKKSGIPKNITRSLS